jgi:hypothetical protein
MLQRRNSVKVGKILILARVYQDGVRWLPMIHDLLLRAKAGIALRIVSS